MKPLLRNAGNIMVKLFLSSLISVCMTIGAFVAVVSFFPAFSFYYSGKLDWGVLDGFVGVLSFSLLVGGFTFALTEYIDAEKAKQRAELSDKRERARYKLEMYQEVVEKFTNPEQRAARKWILANITIKSDNEDIDAWYQKTHAKIMNTGTGGDGVSEGQNALIVTLNSFDYMGFMIMNYWSDEDSHSVFDWVAPAVAKVWKRIGPYVAHIRMLRNAPDWHIPAEFFGNLWKD